MSKLPRVAIAAGLLLLGLIIIVSTANSQPPAKEVAPEPAPPAGQTYTGVKRCASCHFKQFMTWKKTKHAKAFEDMPAKYQGNADCLACHVTGSGVASGYAGGTPDDILENLRAVTCEACHGPGSKHEEVAKKYTNVPKLDAAQEKEVRDAIWKNQPGNVCIRCHTAKGHGADHPAYDKQ